MKISVDIDCTAEEARQFLGLPDVRPLHDAVLGEIKERLLQNMRGMDIDALSKSWMPTNIAGMDQMQKTFWSLMTTAMQRKSEEKPT